jgi:hypothetical protein
MCHCRVAKHTISVRQAPGTDGGMEMSRYVRKLLLACALLALALTPTGATGQNAPVYSPEDKPYGATYSEWAAAWWSLMLSLPASTNPLLDDDGTFCANGQEGNVWFLAGVWDEPGEEEPVTRSCTIPAGTALFVPVANAISCWAPGEPPEERSLAFRRSVARSLIEDANDLFAIIDGVPVSDIDRFYTESKVFKAFLPEGSLFSDFGLDGARLFPCVDAGYYLMVRPLPIGSHTIEFGADFGDFVVDVTYHITIE